MNRIVWMLSLCALVYITGCSPEKKEKENPGKFTVTSPLRADTFFTKEYVASIQSLRNIEIRAQEKGYLQNINVDEGQYVKAGQVLFRIMPKMFEAELLKSQAAVKEAELEMMNTKTLADKNIVSKTELSVAMAKLDEVKADQALAQLHLSLTEIRAPFDGTIDRIHFKQGSLIDEGSLLTTLSDNRYVYAYFNVSEPEYLDFKSRSDANAKPNVTLLLANGQPHKYKGIVETMESEFDNSTGNIAFRARFPNPEMLLKNGETGKVQMTVPITNALIIPQKATYELQDKIYVYVLNKNNVVESKSITVKNVLPDLYVVSGIAQDDKILLEGVQNVKDNDKIAYKYVDPKSVISGLQLLKQ